ncbi:hypothetical protein evm_006033 [Chilo suppressalis]|nr:hypothetical protein evm_006033 [Chilo suppressalis]
MKLSLLFIGIFIAHCKGEVRIAGGEVTTINQYPFAAALLTNVDGAAFIQRCGGSILSRSAILSVASCFYTGDQVHQARNWRARVGSSYSASGGTIYFIRQINIYSTFEPTSTRYDVAVLRTTFDMVFQPGVVEAAFIAGRSYSFSPNQEVRAIGWGEGSNTEEPTTQLRHVDIWVVDQQLCASRYDNDPNIDENVVCAGWIDVGVKGQCPGDNGSPLLDSNNTVVGIFSWAQGCADLIHPGVNTRVSAFTSWIVATALQP